MFEVADGEGSFRVVVGDDVVAYVVGPLVESHYWFEGIGSPKLHSAYSPLGCVNKTAVFWCVFY